MASLIQITINVYHVYRGSVCLRLYVATESALNSRDKKKTRQNSSLAKKWIFLFPHHQTICFCYDQVTSLCFKNLLSTNITKKVKEVLLCLLNIFYQCRLQLLSLLHNTQDSQINVNRLGSVGWSFFVVFFLGGGGWGGLGGVVLFCFFLHIHQ